MKTPILGSNIPRKGNAFSAGLGRLLFRMFGWKFEGEIPNEPQMVIAVAPHSSNFDFVIAMAAVFSLRLRVSYLAKHSLFKFPLAHLMYSTGGIPVNRNSSQGLIAQMVEEFKSKEQLILGIAPEGTRGKTKKWKRGFAYIAQATNVPILPVLLDYKSKSIRFMPLITDLSDVEKTVEEIKTYTLTATPRNTHE